MSSVIVLVGGEPEVHRSVSCDGSFTTGSITAHEVCLKGRSINMGGACGSVPCKRRRANCV